MEQKQLQQATRQQSIQQQELKMEIQQDLNNVLGIAFETQAVLEVLRDKPNDPLINVHLNRLILQINISNCVHADQKERVGDSIRDEKNLAKSRFENVIKGEKLDDRIMDYLEGYRFNLSQKVYIRQKEPLPTQVNAEFNMNTVQKVINSIGQSDNQYQEIHNGKQYQMLSEEELKQQIMNRKKNAVEKTQNYANATVQTNQRASSTNNKNSIVAVQNNSHNTNGIQQPNQNGELSQQEQDEVSQGSIWCGCLR